MRASQFITEEEILPYQREELSTKKFVAMFKQNCTQSMALFDNPLWRGMSNHKEEIVAIWPETGVRASENTSNHYTELMSHSPYMRGWPRRDASIICSSGRDYAESFGRNLYAIFPFDGVEIAVCPGMDLWNTVIKLHQYRQEFSAMNYFNDWLDELNIPDSYEQMVAALKNPNSPASQRLVYKGIDPKTFLPSLLKALSPANTGFQLLSIPQLAAAHPFNKECWIGGPCIAVKSRNLEELREILTGTVTA
jgi:hypothetical protein